MAKDIVPELLELLESDFTQRLGNSDTIKRIGDLIDAGKATYKEANEYAIEVGEILAETFKANLSSSVLPDGRMYYNIAERVLNHTLGHNHDLISDVCAQIQTDLNQTAKIGIAGQRPTLNQSRIDGLINRVSNEPIYDDVAWLLDEPVVNFSQSIVDDSIKTNADFHEKAGLTPKIVRRTTGKCCSWCDRLAGTYEYREVKQTGNDVFRRHQYCKCIVEYLPGDGKKQNVHSKKLVVPEEVAKREARQIIGRKTDQVTVHAVSQHAIEQMAARNVTAESINDAIDRPLLKKPVKIDDQGRPSLTVVGRKATFVINPETGVIITAHPTHTKLAEKLLRREP